MKSDSDLLREIRMFVHITAQTDALDRAIELAEFHEEQERLHRKMKEEMRRIKAVSDEK